LLNSLDFSYDPNETDVILYDPITKKSAIKKTKKKAESTRKNYEWGEEKKKHVA